jgi:hypothetical protein
VVFGSGIVAWVISCFPHFRRIYSVIDTALSVTLKRHLPELYIFVNLNHFLFVPLWLDWSDTVTDFRAKAICMHRLFAWYPNPESDKKNAATVNNK